MRLSSDHATMQQNRRGSSRGEPAKSHDDSPASHPAGSQSTAQVASVMRLLDAGPVVRYLGQHDASEVDVAVVCEPIGKKMGEVKWVVA